MAKYQEREQKSSKGEHRDYKSNLSRARQFCKNVDKSLLDGMKVYIAGSTELPNSLLMIVFTPPIEAKMGNYAAPIFLHQGSEEVSKQTEAIFNSYMKMAKEFWDKQPTIFKLEMPDAINQ